MWEPAGSAVSHALLARAGMLGNHTPGTLLRLRPQHVAAVQAEDAPPPRGTALLLTTMNDAAGVKVVQPTGNVPQAQHDGWLQRGPWGRAAWLDAGVHWIREAAERRRMQRSVLRCPQLAYTQHH